MHISAWDPLWGDDVGGRPRSLERFLIIGLDNQTENRLIISEWEFLGLLDYLGYYACSMYNLP